MNYQQTLTYLNSIKDEKYANFIKPLLNSDYDVIGIRIPLLKQIMKQNIEIDDFIISKYVEIDYLYFAILLKRLTNLTDQLEFLENNIKYAKSWIITDAIPSYLKKINFEDFYQFFIKLYNSNFTYERRLVYVLAIKLSKDKNILKLLPLLKQNEEYIVMMSIAWLLQNIAITFSDDVYNYLKECKDEKLKRKTISKIVDSHIFSNETKTKFKALRK